MVLTSTLFFCETVAQLYFSMLFFKFILAALATKVLVVSGLYLSLSWSLGRSKSLHGSGLLVATVGVDCIPIDKAGVGNYVYIRGAVVSIRTEDGSSIEERG